MEPPLPNLMLIIVQGPRSGETLEFKPGSVIRIGRIKRGNTFSISEDAIATKHLVIDSRSGKWIIEGLDSSNGTILNTSYLSPNSPVDLHDNDNFEIGKETVITVKLKAAIKQDSVLRRNPRRQVNARVTRDVVDTVEIEVNRDIAESSNNTEDNVVYRGVKESGDQVEERVESDVNRDGNTAGGKVGSGVEDNGPNLEKMTLGEWFGYMEVYFPEQIVEATEEMIEGMRRKAERLHDYMRQRKMEKGKQ
ncbi:hypothetical protein Q3G72_002836 [Acer saccharum]|nr:hypothetical protein Q3G72_002836 [Acer saccharum]